MLKSSLEQQCRVTKVSTDVKASKEHMGPSSPVDAVFNVNGQQAVLRVRSVPWNVVVASRGRLAGGDREPGGVFRKWKAAPTQAGAAPHRSPCLTFARGDATPRHVAPRMFG